MTNNKKPMFPVLRVFVEKLREKKVREKAVEKLGSAAVSGVGQALGQEAGRRVTKKIRPGRP